MNFGELKPDVGSPFLKLSVKEQDFYKDLSSFA